MFCKILMLFPQTQLAATAKLQSQSTCSVCSKHKKLSKCFLHADRYVTEGGPAEAEKARILLKLMQFIGAVSGGKTVTQVALNYLMCKGMA